MGLDIYFNKVHREEIGYFRKVNFLVKFFEDRYGITIENLIPITIALDDILVLKSLCKQVLENHELAPSLLPTKDGFFFGNTDYNEWYFKDVEEVLSKCNDLIQDFKEGEFEDCDLEFKIWF